MIENEYIIRGPFELPCPECDMTGEHPFSGDPCPTCGGSGFMEEDYTSHDDYVEKTKAEVLDAKGETDAE